MLVRPHPGAVLRHLHHLDGRRDQPRAVRPPRGRGRAGRRLPHRVLLAEVRALLPRRVHQHGHRVRAGDHAVPRRLARALDRPGVGGRQRGLRPGHLVLRQGAGLRLLLHLAARLAAATALRPVHELRLEVAHPDLAGLDRRRRHAPGRQARRRLRQPRRADRDRDRPGGPRPAVLRRESDWTEEAVAASEDVRAPPGLPDAAHARRWPGARCRRTAHLRHLYPAVHGGGETDGRQARAEVAQGAVLGPGRRVRRHLPHDVPEGRHRAVPLREDCPPRRASTAGTSSTAGPTGWRSASAASCAPGPARPTRSTSRVPPTTTQPTAASASAPASATAASTRSTTCAASCAGCASRRARRGRSR